jgi:hypothetical protein
VRPRYRGVALVATVQRSFDAQREFRRQHVRTIVMGRAIRLFGDLSCRVTLSNTIAEGKAILDKFEKLNKFSASRRMQQRRGTCRNISSR